MYVCWKRLSSCFTSQKWKSAVPTVPTRIYPFKLLLLFLAGKQYCAVIAPCPSSFSAAAVDQQREWWKGLTYSWFLSSFFFLVLLLAKNKKVKEGKSYLSLKGHLERTNFGFMAMGGVECLASLQILLLFLHNNLSLELVYVICSLQQWWNYACC